MSLDKLTMALQEFAALPAQQAQALPAPFKTLFASRNVANWSVEPTTADLDARSVAIANWLNRRGPPPSDLDWEAAAIALRRGSMRFLQSPRFRDGLLEHLKKPGSDGTLARVIDAFFDAPPEEAGELGSVIAQSLDGYPSLADWAQLRGMGFFEPKFTDAAIAQVLLTDEAGHLHSLLLANAFDADGVRRPLLDRTEDGILARLGAGACGDAARSAVGRAVTRLSGLLRAHEDRLQVALVAEIVKYVSKQRGAGIDAGALAAYSLVGDPESGGGAWESLSPGTQAALASWQPRRTIELCFELFASVDPLAEYKRRFWLHLVDLGLLTEATNIAIGPMLTEFQAETERQPWAKYVASGGHSVYPAGGLLMRVAGATVLEWLPKGACRIWIGKSRAAPMLAQQRYEMRAMKAGADFELGHRGSSSGKWQREVLEALSLSPELDRSVYSLD